MGVNERYVLQAEKSILSGCPGRALTRILHFLYTWRITFNAYRLWPLTSDMCCRLRRAPWWTPCETATGRCAASRMRLPIRNHKPFHHRFIMCQLSFFSFETLYPYLSTFGISESSLIILFVPYMGIFLIIFQFYTL
jgi:hypothetical protein